MNQDGRDTSSDASRARRLREQADAIVKDETEGSSPERTADLLEDLEAEDPADGEATKHGKVRERLLPRTKRQLAKEGGLSLHQMRQAIRVANLSDEEFERLVESEHPPTIEQLANIGRRPAPKRRKPKPKTKPCPHCGGTGRIAASDSDPC